MPFALQENQTPLHIAARLGNVDNVVLLLQHGAQPNATTKDQYTPLHIAAKEGHEEVVQVLLEHGANQNLTTAVGPWDKLLTVLQHLGARCVSVNV